MEGQRQALTPGTLEVGYFAKITWEKVGTLIGLVTEATIDLVVLLSHDLKRNRFLYQDYLDVEILSEPRKYDFL